MMYVDGAQDNSKFNIFNITVRGDLWRSSEDEVGSNGIWTPWNKDARQTRV